MLTLKINDITVEIEEGKTILNACEKIGLEIPRFCYHPLLSIAGNCRMCLVEVEKSPKPVASCSMPVSQGMVVHTHSPFVEKARQGVLELLLINHPLDCPICDQGGECDLQDLTFHYGLPKSRYDFSKRAAGHPPLGPLIKPVMTRCIHCTRCIRFCNEVAGIPELGSFHRGEKTEILPLLEKGVTSELSGNLIDICPVGALTNKPYAFQARSWELTKTNSIDTMDAVGCHIRIDTRRNKVMRILPRFCSEINEEWISDKTRFNFDGLFYQRLDTPYVRKEGKLHPSSWEEGISLATHMLKSTNPSQIAALVGDQADCESIFILKQIMTHLNVPHLDCRQDGTCHDATNRGSYLFNTTIARIEQADAILLVGTNPRTEAVLVNTRIRKRYMKGGVEIASIGAPIDLTYPYLHLGDQAFILKDILEGTHSFCKKLASAQFPMMIIGQGALNRRDGGEILHICQAIAEKFNLIQEEWNGFNVLHTAAARVGALDLGFVPQEKGMVTQDIVSACQKGEIKVLYLLGADEIPFSQLGDTFVIYQGHHGDEGAHRADLILPGVTSFEKSATYVNTEGRAQQTTAVSPPPGQAQEDWKILNTLAEALHLPFSYPTCEKVRERLVQENPLFSSMGTVHRSPWHLIERKTPETLSHLPFKSVISHFYGADPISRHSPVMAQCYAAVKGGDSHD